jgi:hypothetical protein
MYVIVNSLRIIYLYLPRCYFKSAGVLSCSLPLNSFMLFQGFILLVTMHCTVVLLSPLPVTECIYNLFTVYFRVFLYYCNVNCFGILITDKLCADPDSFYTKVFSLQGFILLAMLLAI